jgi:hypothetical protein
MPMKRILETDLYLPVKAHFEALGYEVKAEVKDADVMAMRPDVPDAPPVIIELKTGFTLTLLHQAVARQSITDHVYVAVPRWKGRAGWKAFKANIGLCKRLGLGVISVNTTDNTIQMHNEPKPFTPRKNTKRTINTLKEFETRIGDPNIGGTPGGARVTAYRQDAEKCRDYLKEHGPTKGADVAKATGVTRATPLMRSNHYGWFEKVETGVYRLV